MKEGKLNKTKFDIIIFAPADIYFSVQANGKDKKQHVFLILKLHAPQSSGC